MNNKFITAIVLVALTLTIQCAWIASLIVWVRTFFERKHRPFGTVGAACLMVWITGHMIVLHVLEILLWSVFYWWKCFPSWAEAVYFSAGAYTTIGSESLLPPPEWRMFQPLESLTGILMCGLSASFLFAIVMWLVHHEETSLTPDDERRLAPHVFN